MSDQQNSQKTHIRRCHVCGGVTEHEHGPVLRCSHCGKSIAPFYFYDDDQVIEFSENEPRPEPGLVGQELRYQFPVRGLTACW